MTDKAELAWRNATVHWHMDQRVPLACGCDDDTPDGALCEPSVRYADRMVGQLGTGADDLEGAADPWQHDVWVAAWGRNAPLILSGNELPGVPAAPVGMAWLATRGLVRGRRAVELLLLRLGAHRPAVVARARALPDPESIAGHARRILRHLTD